MTFSVLSQQVRWRQPEMLSAGVDQSRLVIADAPTASESFSFLVMGDTDAGIEAGIEEKGSAFAEGFANQLLRQLGESRFVLHTGDVTYPMGSYENYFKRIFVSLSAFIKAVAE